MSDDDCDIFNLPVQRINAVPPKQFVPDRDSIEADYDFIKITHAVKKPAKAAKAKQTTQTKSKSRKKLKDDEKLGNYVEQEGPVEEAQASTTRSLSPVSQLIYEMEEQQAKARVKEMEKLPIARRTRSSMGNPEKSKEKEQAAPVEVTVSLPVKRNARGRKATAAPRATRAATVNVALPQRSRQQAAELAARANVLDCIDLVSAVMPRIEGIVNLDSDEDNDNKLVNGANGPESSATGYNFDDDNPIIEINLKWLGEIQTYKLRQHQKFSHMFKEVAKRNGLPREDIIINLDEHFIDPTESPQSVGLKVFHILNGGTSKSNNTTTAPKQHENLLLKPKKFQLKIQGDKWKRPLVIPIKKTEPFKMLYIKCAEEMECDVNDLKLFFDGELLDPDDTPKNQDMEGNEMIDLRSNKA